jgi:hypothetical protein
MAKTFDTYMKVTKQSIETADRSFARACDAQARGDRDTAAQSFAHAKNGYERAERAVLSAADIALNMPEE